MTPAEPAGFRLQPDRTKVRLKGGPHAELKTLSKFRSRLQIERAAWLRKPPSQLIVDGRQVGVSVRRLDENEAERLVASLAWFGSTLARVVDRTNFIDDVWLDAEGHPHSDTVTDRVSRKPSEAERESHRVGRVDMASTGAAR